MNHPLNRRGAVQAVAAGLAAFCALPLRAQPDRTTRIVVPFPAGAGTDAVGRLMAQKLTELLEHTVVVDNRAGASGAIGTQFVAQSRADGHTLLLIAAPFTTVAAAMPGAGYDPVRHFAAVGMIANGPLVWAVNKDLPVRSLRELVALARQKPGYLNYGSAGAGGINHLVLEMLKSRSQVHITHIPYRGVAPATTDMIAGQVHVVTGTVPALAPFISEGRVRALAVTSAQRSSALPEVPGMAEAGFPDFNVLNYFGLVAPSRTPATVVERLNAAVARAVALPDVRERFARDAVEPATGSPADLARFIEQDYLGWQRVVSAQNLRIDVA